MIVLRLPDSLGDTPQVFSLGKKKCSEIDFSTWHEKNEVPEIVLAPGNCIKYDRLRIPKLKEKGKIIDAIKNNSDESLFFHPDHDTVLFLHNDVNCVDFLSVNTSLLREWRSILTNIKYGISQLIPDWGLLPVPVNGECYAMSLGKYILIRTSLVQGSALLQKQISISHTQSPRYFSLDPKHDGLPLKGQLNINKNHFIESYMVNEGCFKYKIHLLKVFLLLIFLVVGSTSGSYINGKSTVELVEIDQGTKSNQDMIFLNLMNEVSKLASEASFTIKKISYHHKQLVMSITAPYTCSGFSDLIDQRGIKIIETKKLEGGGCLVKLSSGGKVISQ
ncbi:hypothetical protein [Serratia quinivorans]|uniref:hypothetical protein n=1 Tax=Serratia quinivorans TaxID=137545 RepID=UPI00217C363A|nr:hypothetical protein [Serratia quinivorans]CAI1114744.1 Type II secretory pathway, component PulL [Serratia quinivorans]CAI1876221.1 Type II secretory pathway, component PulL [Serratia quinivorans]